MMIIVSVKLYLFLFDANISARASASVLINTTGASIRWQKNIRFSAKRLALIHRAMIGTYATWSRWLQLLTVAKKAIRCYKRTSILVSIVSVWILCKHTVWNLNFLSKNSTLISRENCRFFFWVKNSWKCCGFGLFSCWQLWFHEKNCQKKFGGKTRENVGVLSKLTFWTKNWLFE